MKSEHPVSKEINDLLSKEHGWIALKNAANHISEFDYTSRGIELDTSSITKQ